ncbi:DUF4345 domain-containing protein [Sporocytophaga myxococcoides]|uniref:DUF4345 domain-containing protein n=1 Tax=Sporocytophaga myxococcoides TaxID=153721 RepID=UPI001FE1A30A|nr:DUF4345 domain-containing protein [Sporocytophaga myxococcoides]
MLINWRKEQQAFFEDTLILSAGQQTTIMNRFINYSGIFIICLTALGILMVSIMAFSNPQAVMDLVQVKLHNNDAYSSIRGVYGGAGMTIFITLTYLLFKNRLQGLAFVALLCGSYSLSRIITIFSEGALGSFGTNWMFIEGVLCIAALALLFANRKVSRV